MSENEQKSSYRQVMKATSIFGGVQAFNILIGLVRTKFASVFLGPAGYGINSLLSSPLGIIGSFTGLGIGFSAIRNISESYAKGDLETFSRTVITFRRWVWVTGLLGMLITLAAAPYLSYISFGHYDYTWAFMVLSITFLINAISGGQGAVLYGTRRIKDTAKSATIGGILGIFTAIPLYYLYGIGGIVPAILAASCTSLLLSWYFSRRVQVKKINVSYRETFFSGLSFVKVGFMMMLSGIMGSTVAYGLTIFISHIGGESQVGLYNSAWSITERFVGMVFAAMAADYYPRLSAVNDDNEKVSTTVNQQAEIGILILGPIMLLYLLTLPVIIPILQTREFLAIIPLSQWVIMGMLIKVLGWAMGFIALAKGKSGLFFKLELFSTAIQTINMMIAYYLWGLEGAGIAFVFTYLVYVSYIYIFYRIKIQLTCSRELLKVFMVLQGLCVCAFFAIRFLPLLWGNIAVSIMFIGSVIFSLIELNKRMDLKPYFLKLKNKFIR